MANSENNYTVRSKIWIEDNDGNVVFGLGRMSILEAINQHGSMNAAAKQLKMSYRSVWCRIRESEERIGKELVIRQGKGSVLTDFAKQLLTQFKELEFKFTQEADHIFDEFMAKSLSS